MRFGLTCTLALACGLSACGPDKRSTLLPAYTYVSSTGSSLALTSDETFRFTVAEGRTFDGSYLRSRETGFLILTVDTTKGEVGVAKGATFVGTELPGLSLVLQGPEGSIWNEPQVFVTLDKCPTGHAEMVALRKPSTTANSFLSGYLEHWVEEAGRLGVVGRYTPGDTLPLPTDRPEEGLLASSSCDAGVGTGPDGTRLVFGGQGSLLLDGPWGSFLGLPFAPSPGLTSMASELVGFFWDESQRNGDGTLKRPPLVGLTLKAGVGSFRLIADAEKGGRSDEPVSSDTYALRFDRLSPNSPQRGYWQGELRTDDTHAAETLCLAGAARGDAYRDYLFCTGASPRDPNAKVWMYLVTPLPSSLAPQSKN